jgi:hypothetical protein
MNPQLCRLLYYILACNKYRCSNIKYNIGLIVGKITFKKTWYKIKREKQNDKWSIVFDFNKTEIIEKVKSICKK